MRCPPAHVTFANRWSTHTQTHTHTHTHTRAHTHTHTRTHGRARTHVCVITEYRYIHIYSNKPYAKRTRDHTHTHIQLYQLQLTPTSRPRNVLVVSPLSAISRVCVLLHLSACLVGRRYPNTLSLQFGLNYTCGVLRPLYFCFWSRVEEIRVSGSG